MNVARTATAVVAMRLQLNSKGPRTPRWSCRFYVLRAMTPTTMTAMAVRRRDYGGSSPRHTESLDNRALSSEAQNVVGCHTTLGRETSDEKTEVTSHSHQMTGSDHPLLKMTQSLRLYHTPRDLQAWRRVVLLVSKAAGHSNADSSAEEDECGVLHSQRALAEVAEMMRTSHLMHNGLVDVSPVAFPDRSDRGDLSFGNKIALLGGDYLMAYSLYVLSTLKNPHLTELIWSGLRDLTEAVFVVGRRDAQHNPLPSPFKPLDPQPPGPSRLRFDPFQPCGAPLQGISAPLTPALRDWTRRNVLSAGSLLGKSCQGALLLAGHGERLQRQGFVFGKHLSLAWQACLDLEPFESGSPYLLGISFRLYSAPVMFHLEHDSSLFEEIDKGVNSIEDVDFVKIHSIVMNGPGIDHTEKLREEHSQKALEVLDVFEENDARTALSNIIMAMKRE